MSSIPPQPTSVDQNFPLPFTEWCQIQPRTEHLNFPLCCYFPLFIVLPDLGSDTLSPTHSSYLSFFSEAWSASCFACMRSPVENYNNQTSTVSQELHSKADKAEKYFRCIFCCLENKNLDKYVKQCPSQSQRTGRKGISQSWWSHGAFCGHKRGQSNWRAVAGSGGKPEPHRLTWCWGRGLQELDVRTREWKKIFAFVYSL